MHDLKAVAVIGSSAVHPGENPAIASVEKTVHAMDAEPSLTQSQSPNSGNAMGIGVL